MKLRDFKPVSCLLLVPLVLFNWVSAAKVTPLNQDVPFFGFNDPTPRTPVGGNPGTTLGQQRFNVLKHVCEEWGKYLASDVEVFVGAKFLDEGGDVAGFTLGSALSQDVFYNFPNTPQKNVWYPGPLANAYAGTDLEPNRADIDVIINIALDTNSTIPSWYYGLDGNSASNQMDLAQVLRHELAHGLGFASEFDPFTGEFLLGLPDTYSLNLYDRLKKKGWGEMTDVERTQSSESGRYLVWNGPFTTNSAKHFLNRQHVVAVSEPEVIAGEYVCLPADFAGVLPESGLSGEVVVVNDGNDPSTDACDPIQNAAELVGKIAYIDRGDCFFDAKVYAAQQAGAIGVIIANNIPFSEPINMVGEDIVNGVPLTIPVVSLSWEAGQYILEASVAHTVNVRLGLSEILYAGMLGDQVRMYAPPNYEFGSSVSHFTDEADPDLLMEPRAGAPVDDLDLTLTAMKDLGWTILDIPYMHRTYEEWISWNFAPEDELIGETDDPDGDLLVNFVEYFFNGDPLVPNEELLPVVEVDSPDHRVSFVRAKHPEDVDYRYEFSLDAASWKEAVEGVDYTLESVEDLHVGAERVHMSFTGIPNGSPFFIRISVERKG